MPSIFVNRNLGINMDKTSLLLKQKGGVWRDNFQLS